MTQHPQAEILRAIADGKEVQYRSEVTGDWLDCHLFTIARHPDWTFRIKPKTLSINGREFECPIELDGSGSQFSVTVQTMGSAVTFWHHTKEARDLHAKILIEESTPK